MELKESHIQSLYKSALTFPDEPGIYQFLDDNGKVIYVGKAKNLKKRILSYFNKLKEPGNKIRLLIKNASNIKHFVVDNENEALLLENSLIKKYQPRYNVQLKDDKTYPWICIKNELFPRVLPIRNRINDGSEYYGPFTSMKAVKTLMDLIKKLYPLRTCKYQFTRKGVQEGKFKVCLEYHIGNCKGPCEDYQSEEEYNKNIEQIREILKGNMQECVDYLENEMNNLANNLQFEKAQVFKEKINLLKNFINKSKVVNPRIHNSDVFSIINEESKAFVNYLKIVNGAIVQIHTLEMKKKLQEEEQELLGNAILEIRKKLNSTSEEIIVPNKEEIAIPGVHITVPKAGDKKKLLDLSYRNLSFYKYQISKNEAKTKAESSQVAVLEKLSKALHMKELPVHIECFDNSNIQGHYPVASCVVFKNGRPAKRDYRHFHIKNVEGVDDYASMKEVVYRRYKRFLEEDHKLPDLVVIDGGKGQLSAAIESLNELGINNHIKTIGIAKRLEEIYQENDSVPLYLDKKSEALKLIQFIRDEAHRFGISFHRKLRSKKGFQTELVNVPGIGLKTAQKLLSHYKSLNAIKQANQKDVENLIGKDKACKIVQYFSNSSTT